VTELWVGARRLRPDPARAIGKGGEADVYDVGGGLALKVYKRPDHPDYRGQPEEQRAARERLRARGPKLREFPRGLPGRVVAPLELATDRAGRAVLGYTMSLVPQAEPLRSWGEVGFRARGAGVDGVPGIFLDLHGTVAGLHAAGVVIGDFNDLNVLVSGPRAHLIDADSFQFGPYLCDVYTERFVDPLVCGPAALRPSRPFTELSDWYAFAAMLVQSLLCVGPHGGVHRGTPPSERALRRITIFHPEVVYPRPALPYRVLPDDLLHEFHEIFERDRREVFPRRLIEALRFTRCAACGREHARAVCPDCSRNAPAAVREVVTARGRVTATRLVSTSGTVVEAAPDGWLLHEGDEFRREDGSLVMRGEFRPDLKVRLLGRSTLVGRRGRLTVLPGSEVLSAEDFDATGRDFFWIDNGQLLRRTSPSGSTEYVGDVLAGQTRFWAGPEFGLGFYRAGHVSVAFVFDASRRGINDAVRLPPMGGRLLDAACVFGARRAWLFLALEAGGRTVSRLVAVRPDGIVEASADDGPWTGAIHGVCASGPHLFVPTDRGVVRVEGDLGRCREFPDTEPFVDSASRLVACPDGLRVVHRQEILVLRIGGQP
jgi:hypothetical protein